MISSKCILQSQVSERSETVNYMYNIFNLQKQPPRGILTKRCSENMQQIYGRTSMPKCDFNKVRHLYWNRTSAWVFCCKFAAYFQNTFSEEQLGSCFWTCFFVKCEIPIDLAALTKKNVFFYRNKYSIAAVALKTINHARADFFWKFIFKMKLVDVGNSKWFLIYNMIMFLQLNYWDVFWLLTTYSQELGKLKLTL